jgi:hypothetical protein
MSIGSSCWRLKRSYETRKDMLKETREEFSEVAL